MQAFQERVIAEKDELFAKLDKLNEFIKGEIFNSLPKDERERLVRQANHMSNYYYVLNERIAAF